MKVNLYALAKIMIILIVGGCSSERQVPDVSNIKVDVVIKRYDQALFAIDTSNVAAGLENLGKKYPEFQKIFLDEVIKASDPRYAPEGTVKYVEGFLTHPAVRRLYDTCQVIYSDMSDIKTDFDQAFRFFKYYFPQKEVPDITTFISEYSYGVFVYGKNSLGVGLDFFLGEDYPYLKYNEGNPNFSDYLTRTFSKKYLVEKTMKAYIDDLVGEPGGKRLLDIMVNNGKKLYLLDQFLPYAPDSIKLEYTQKQVDWCKDNELEMWAHFLKEDLLFTTKWDKMRKLVDYSPNSPGMPPEAPGRTANFMGWQIIKAYMQKYPKTTLQELIDLRDAQLILNKSKYKPRRN